MAELDAVVVGAGPNGLAAAVRLAEHGYHTRLIEAADVRQVSWLTRIGKSGTGTVPGKRNWCASAHLPRFAG